MRAKLLWIFACLSVVPAVVACGPVRKVIVDETPTPAPLSRSNVPCASPLTENPDEDTAYGLLAFYDEVIRKYEETQSPVSNSSKNYEEESKAFEAYWHNLEAKRIESWQGWVVSMGRDATYSTYSWKYDPYKLRPELGAVVIALYDPNIAPKSPYFGHYRYDPPIVLAQRVYMPGETADNLCLGDKISFSGNISVAPNSASLGIVLNDAQVQLLEKRPTKASVAADLAGLKVTLRRYSCFMGCPVYRTTLYDDGTLVFTGLSNTRAAGFKIGHLDEAAMREVIREVERAGFFSEKSYISNDMTDHPAVTLSVTMHGETHTIEHYHGDTSAPASLFELEDKLDELLNASEWVR